MPDEIGALNTEIDPLSASPAEEALPFFETKVVDDPEEFERLAAGAVDPNADPEPSSQAQDDADPAIPATVVKKAEGSVPYERFDQVNKKALEAEKLLSEARERETMLNRAYQSGYSTVEAYRAADTWAKANNYGSIEGYRAHQEEQAELQRYTASLDQRDDLSDAARNELITARQQNIETRSAQREINEQMNMLRATTLEQSIEAARSTLGGLDPELENIFRGSDPQIVHSATQALKRQTDVRVADLEAQIAQLKAQSKGVATNAKGEYAATKLAQTKTPPPEGRGGASPTASATATPTGFKTRSFAELIFRQNPKG